MGKYLFALFVFLNFVFAARCQDYSFKNYRVHQGLPSDIVKASIQDSLGYFWIATDEGLVKYDGMNFTTYRRVVHSNYIKGFLRTRAGGLIAFGDLDLLEIHNLGDTVVFKSLCPVSEVSNDSTLSYPKLVYEDRAGNLWIAESQSVVCLSANRFKRYAFDLSDRSPQFLRSFSFFEDLTGNLFTSSLQGNLFRHDLSTDTFVKESVLLPHNIEFMSAIDSSLFIGSREGVFLAALKPEGGISTPAQKVKAANVSYIARVKENDFVIGTRSSAHFIGKIREGTIEKIDFGVNSVNHIYISTAGDIWLSTDNGLLLMRKNLFNAVNPNIATFIEAVAEVSKTTYYATSQTLFSYDRENRTNSTVLDIPGGYFQSLAFQHGTLWIANAFVVMSYRNGQVGEKYDFTKFGRFVTNLSADSRGNIWLTIPGLADAYYIDATLRLNRISVPLKKGAVINIIKEGNDGIYIGSSGKEAYLFYKPHLDSAFRDVSVSLKTIALKENQFSIFDLSYFDNRLWLATSAGVLEMSDGHIRQVDLGKRFKGMPVKLILHDGKSKIITQTSFGLLLYDVKSGTVELFNESCGLLSNTITPRGVVVSADQSLWVGTSKGLCHSVEPFAKATPTHAPYFVSILSNGETVKPATSKFAYGSFVSIHVSSITFPEDEVIYQYRLHPDTTWNMMQAGELTLSSLSSGAHLLEVRAKQNGPFTWSEPSQLNLTVEHPYWEMPWFYFVILLSGATLVFFTAIISRRYNRQAKEKLSRLIEEKTKQLTETNKALVELNEEKNNLIGIVAHDLKAPLQQMIGLHQLIRMSAKVNGEIGQYLSKMEDSTLRLNAMIKKILDVDAINNQNTIARLERVNLVDIITRVTDRFADDAEKKEVKLRLELPEALLTKADSELFEQAFENLLSNAIKFSPQGKNVSIRAFYDEACGVCEIKDEGPGFTDDDKTKMFGKYQKLTARPTAGESSSGLGLSIVKKYVTDMSGSISCESTQGKGATFRVSIPRW